MSESMFCFICGAILKICDCGNYNGYPSQPYGIHINTEDKPSSRWLRQVRFVYWDRNTPDTQPQVSDKIGCLYPRYRPCMRLWDPERKEHDVFPTARLFNARPRSSNAGVEDCSAYPAHSVCWNILESLLKFDLTLESGEDFNNSPDYRSRIKSLFMILGSCPYTSKGIIWPHDYLETAGYREARLQDLSVAPSLMFLEHSPDSYPLEYNFPHTPAHAQIVDFAPSLPVELVEKILLNLDWSDLQSLSKVPSNSTLTVPDGVWSNLLKVKSELGYAAHWGNRSSNSVSAYQLCQLSDDWLKNDVLQVKNSHRVWTLCKWIARLVEDNIKSKLCGFSIPPDFPFAARPTFPVPDPFTYPTSKNAKGLMIQPFWPQAGTEPTSYGYSVCSGGRVLSWEDASPPEGPSWGLAVSFVGTGRLRYVSGIRLLPSDAAVGYINLGTEKIMILGSGEKDDFKRVCEISIAHDNIGIIDISVVPFGSDPEWAGGSDTTTPGVAISTRQISYFSDGIYINRLHVGIDAFKLTRLWLESPNFENLDGSTDGDEVFFRRRAWESPISPLELTRDETWNRFCYYEPYQTSEDKLVWEDFCPFAGISFRDETIVRFTCWYERSYVISGITVWVLGEDEEVVEKTLGASVGAAIDFPINGKADEAIRSMAIVSARGLSVSTRSIVGIKLETTFYREFDSSPNEDERRKNGTIKTRAIGPTVDNIVTGIYGSFARPKYSPTDNQPNRFLYTLGCTIMPEDKVLSLGISSLALEEQEERSVLEQKPTNARNADAGDDFYDSDPVEYNRSLDVSSRGHFGSIATLEGCSSISVFKQPGPENRITGLSLCYGISTAGAKGQLGNPRLLGQISKMSSEGSFQMDCGEGERIRFLNIFESISGKCVPSEPRRIVTGLQFHTTKGSAYSFGCVKPLTEQEQGDLENDMPPTRWCTQIYNGLKQRLVWDFNVFFDHVFA